MRELIVIHKNVLLNPTPYITVWYYTYQNFKQFDVKSIFNPISHSPCCFDCATYSHAYTNLTLPLCSLCQGIISFLNVK